jgi:hypothetical protein
LLILRIDKFGDAENLQHLRVNEATEAPTAAPPTAGFYCPAYYVDYSKSNTENYDTCTFYACKGDSILINGCNEYCNSPDTDMVLTLFAEEGGPVATSQDCENDEYGHCSYLTYDVVRPCQEYTLREGCSGIDYCGGQVQITGTNGGTASPTYTPTQAPTVASNTPTTAAPSSGYCPHFDADQTDNAEVNYVTCSIYACPGSDLVINGCNSECLGNLYFKLHDEV